MRLLVPHAGRLYAGNGYWEDRPGPEGLQGAQILVLDTPGGRWRVDHAFEERLPSGRWRDLAVGALADVDFATDWSGRMLPRAVSLLLASTWDLTGQPVSSPEMMRPVPGLPLLWRRIGRRANSCPKSAALAFIGTAPQGSISSSPGIPRGASSAVDTMRPPRAGSVGAPPPDSTHPLSQPRSPESAGGFGYRALPKPMAGSMPRSGNRSMSETMGRYRNGASSIPIRARATPKLD